MKVTVILEPDNHIAITVSRDTFHSPPVKPTGETIMGTIRRTADECCDRAMELGFIE